MALSIFVSALNEFFSNCRQVPLVFTKILHVNPAPVFLAGKPLEDPDCCWFECWACATLPIPLIFVSSLDSAGAVINFSVECLKFACHRDDNQEKLRGSCAF